MPVARAFLLVDPGRCARSVGLHAHGLAGRGRTARRSGRDDLWPSPWPSHECTLQCTCYGTGAVADNSGGRRDLRTPQRHGQLAPPSLRGRTRARADGCSDACHRCRGTHAGPLRCGLSARCRRQASGCRLRAGRPHQHLYHRRRRLDHHAADRPGAGARTFAGLARQPRSPPSFATAISASLRSPSRSNPTGRSSSSARCRRPASILTCPT